MEYATQHTREYIDNYIKRALAFRALRKIRVIVDEINAQDESNRQAAKNILLVSVIAILFLAYQVISTPSAIDAASGNYGEAELTCEK